MTDDEKCYENKVEGLESLQGGDAAVTYQLNDELNQHPVNSLPTSCRRVKLYEIGSTSDTWIDKGTGFCFFDGDLDSENPKLLVSLEHYGVKSLVSTYIKDNTDYSSQNDSIIIWHEGSDTRLYRAISFQNVVGHNACWKYISNFVDGINLQTTDSKALTHTSETNSEFRVLPVPTVNSVLKLESNLESYNTISDGFYLDLYDKKWLKELFGVLNNCILSEDLATASAISSILVKLILKWCCSLELMHIFVSDDIFFNLLKAFEYDSELMKHNVKMEHVKFFREFVRHHQVVPLNNTLFYELIQANYRINYLKDVVLPRHLDEFSIQRINSTLFSNMAEIMNIILNEENNFFELLKAKLSTNYMAALFLRELLLVTRSTNLISQTDRNSLILMVRNYQLLNELTGYLDGTAQAITIYRETLLPLNLQSNQYYHTIKRFLTAHNTKGVVDVNGDTVDTSNASDKPDESAAIDFVENLENDNDDYENGNGVTLDRDELRPNLLCTGRHRLIEPLSLVIEIFHICQEIFPAILRSAVFIDAEVNKTPKLFLSLCDILLRESNEGLQSQTREIISRLLDPKSMDLPDKDEVCNLFYDKGVLDYLMSYLTTGYPDVPNKKEEADTTTNTNTNTNTNGNTINTNTNGNNLENNDENGLDKDGERKDNREVLKEATVPAVTSELRVNAILNIMELLCLCAREHKHRFKLRILSQKIPLKLIKSSMCPYDKFLVIGSIKFIKVCIQMKDKLVNKHIIRYNVLRYVMWILRFKVETNSVNGSILESVCLSILSTIETIGSDSLVVYLFEDSFCSSVLNEFKSLNSCFQIVVGNLKRVYNNKLIFDENKWFEDEEEEEFELKNKIINEGLQDQLISLYNTCDDDQWILNKKHHSENVKSEVGLNNKIMVKLKTKKEEKTLVEEFLLDIQDSDK